MGLIPENLERLHIGEEFVRSKSLDAIRTDDDLLRHAAVVEKAMDLLHYQSMNPPREENDDERAVRLLGMRLFNGCASAFQLITSGYYQMAAMIMRDLLETVFLLGFFHHDPTKITEWRTAADASRREIFAPAKVRTALDDRDGFTERKRAAAYRLLSELAAHPTYKSLQMLAPKGHEAHCGPFFDSTALKATVEELAKLAAQAGQSYGSFSKAKSKEGMATRIYFLEACGDWTERYFGRPFNRKDIDDMKAMLARME